LSGIGRGVYRGSDKMGRGPGHGGGEPGAGGGGVVGIRGAEPLGGHRPLHHHQSCAWMERCPPPFLPPR